MIRYLSQSGLTPFIRRHHDLKAIEGSLVELRHLRMVSISHDFRHRLPIASVQIVCELNAIVTPWHTVPTQSNLIAGHRYGCDCKARLCIPGVRSRDKLFDFTFAIAVRILP